MPEVEQKDRTSLFIPRSPKTPSITRHSSLSASFSLPALSFPACLVWARLCRGVCVPPSLSPLGAASSSLFPGGGPAAVRALRGADGCAWGGLGAVAWGRDGCAGWRWVVGCIGFPLLSFCPCRSGTGAILALGSGRWGWGGGAGLLCPIIWRRSV
jgi:hypothetical protein